MPEIDVAFHFLKDQDNNFPHVVVLKVKKNGGMGFVLNYFQRRYDDGWNIFSGVL